MLAVRSFCEPLLLLENQESSQAGADAFTAQFCLATPLLFSESDWCVAE